MMTTDEAIKIFSEIEACPPLMRGKASAAHVGKEVDWIAIFFSGEMESKERAFVAFRHEPSKRMIFAHVKIADYPWLQTAQRGEPVQLRGRIAGIDPLRIKLDAVSLTRVAEAVH